MDEFEFLLRRLQKQQPSLGPITVANSNRSLLDHLRRERRKDNLTLVLGAGASAASRLPDWKTLVERLILCVMSQPELKALSSHLRRSNLVETRKVRFLEAISRGFHVHVRDALYQDVARKLNNRLLSTVATMIKRRISGSSRRQVVITYNFDNLLEEHLSAVGISRKVWPVYSDKTHRDANGQALIYHPHGYIPRGGKLEEMLDTPLVFSERSYHRQHFDPNHWATLVQMDAFMQSTCLFVGCSLTDPNVRRLLDRANERHERDLSHVAIMRRAQGHPKVATLTDYVVERDLASLGVRPLWIKDYKEIPKLLNAI